MIQAFSRVAGRISGARVPRDRETQTRADGSEGSVSLVTLAGDMRMHAVRGCVGDVAHSPVL